ncbi:uncharacterized protein LOC132277762 [Cornus florida]|uniref:uncharacterized protein LOC132277762 n=1 Tax=Cornus florida TaxID=4283 RepID=UPI0028A2D047|nr:uncharacterized protein LOC132277762 [Cornus florida]
MGRVWVLWNPLVLSLIVMSENSQVLNCAVWLNDLKVRCLVSLVYAANTHTERLPLWRNLKQHHELGVPWILMGDFNVTLGINEAFGGAPRWSQGMEDFKNCVFRNELEDLRYTGIFFTWTNSSFGAANISKKLDRVLINYDWMCKFPQSSADFLPHGISDHSPMVQGTKMFCVVQKLRALKHPLKMLNRNDYGDISLKVAAYDLLRINEREIAKRYANLCLAEEMFFKQKAQVHWLRVGDQNTAYFMKCFSSKVNKRKINSIEDHNGEVLQGIDLQNTFLNHFQNLLGQSYNHYPGMSSFSNLISKSVPANLIPPLTDILTDLEIQQSILSINPYKSPGLDGFNSCFFSHTWPIIG